MESKPRNFGSSVDSKQSKRHHIVSSTRFSRRPHSRSYLFGHRFGAVCLSFSPKNLAVLSRSVQHNRHQLFITLRSRSPFLCCCLCIRCSTSGIEESSVLDVSSGRHLSLDRSG